MTPEKTAVEGGVARFDLLEVTLQSFIAGVSFQESDAAEHLGDQGEADVEILSRHVIQRVTTNDEVVGFGEIDAAEIGETSKFEVPFLSEPLHGIFARIDAEVADARPKALENGLPLSFSAADVEDRAHGALEVKFGDAENHGGFPRTGGGGADPVFGMAVPFVEIRLVVVAGCGSHGHREAGNSPGEKRSSFRFRRFFC